MGSGRQSMAKTLGVPAESAARNCQLLTVSCFLGGRDSCEVWFYRNGARCASEFQSRPEPGGSSPATAGCRARCPCAAAAPNRSPTSTDPSPPASAPATSQIHRPTPHPTPFPAASPRPAARRLAAKPNDVQKTPPADRGCRKPPTPDPPQRRPTSKSRSPSRTPREIWSPASPGATSRSTRTTPAKHIKVFTVDPYPLSIAFVIDQSLTSDVMDKVNNSLDAIQGALTPYDELSVFTYSNGAQDRSPASPARRAPAPAVRSVHGQGHAAPTSWSPSTAARSPAAPSASTATASTPTSSQGSPPAAAAASCTIPKEIHTLNDAILAAAKELSTPPQGPPPHHLRHLRRQGIRQQGHPSKKSSSYLADQQDRRLRHARRRLRRAGARATSAASICPSRCTTTSSTSTSRPPAARLTPSATSTASRRATPSIAKEARNQYTLVYDSHESFYDSKYRKIDVRVDRPGLDVTAKLGYYPSAQMSAP